jgi:peroxiredoxin
MIKSQDMSIRSLFVFTLLLLAVQLLPAQEQQKEEVVLRCELTDCVQRPSLFQFDGSTFRPVQGPKELEEGVYQFTVPAGTPEFYYVGTHSRNRLPLILGDESQVTVKSSCKGIAAAEFAGSPLNTAYLQLKEDMNQLKQSAQRLTRAYQISQEEQRQKVAEQLQALDEKKLALLDSAKQQHPYLGRIVGLNTYLSYQNNKEDYPNEIEYFANEFFRFADFKDPAYDHLPWVYESFRSYTQVLASIPQLSSQQRIAYLEQTLSRFESGSPAYKLALSGTMVILKKKDADSFLHFAEQFASAFEESDPAAVANLKKEMEQIKAFTQGSVAPDFTQNNPEGEEVSLSDFRGKVVLIDFWASWCGPCRRENPNVVKLYEKYKDQGFEIIGVSLDRKKDRWLQAIEADGLAWPHVSDLKGWQNEVAQLYGVGSIPHTVLLDREGKIIAQKLRGPALESKLAALMGE